MLYRDTCALSASATSRPTSEPRIPTDLFNCACSRNDPPARSFALLASALLVCGCGLEEATHQLAGDPDTVLCLDACDVSSGPRYCRGGDLMERWRRLGELKGAYKAEAVECPPCSPDCRRVAFSLVVFSTTMADFWSAVGGSLVGGSFALLGSWLVQTKTAEREREQRKAERRDQLLDELRQAYVTWEAAMHRGMSRCAELLYAREDNEALKRIAKELRDDPEIMGVAVELLENDSEARKRLKNVVGLWQQDVENVVRDAPFEDRQNDHRAFVSHFSEFSEWLSEARFRF